jgi:hypothetical protein
MRAKELRHQGVVGTTHMSGNDCSSQVGEKTSAKAFIR